MTNHIVFSKDRAMQLELFLNSFYKNMNLIDPNINVLYTSSNELYENGYTRLKLLYPNVKFIKESKFKTDLLNIIYQNMNCKHIVFFTDDDIIYRSINIYEGYIENIFSTIKCTTFSLRLGLNTTYCYTMNQPNKLSEYRIFEHMYDIKLDDIIIDWDIKNSTNDYAYPLSVDGHYFLSTYIMNLAKNLDYSNPNTFEAILSLQSKLDMKIASFKTSALVNNPINKVQNVFQNVAGIKYGMPEQVLNEAFLDGMKVDLENLDFSEIKSPHQEIKLKFLIDGK
jgi:hypothetical protein